MQKGSGQFAVGKEKRKRLSMRRIIIGSCLLALLISGSATSVTNSNAQDPPARGRKPHDVYTLGTEAKLGVVTFRSHHEESQPGRHCTDGLHRVPSYGTTGLRGS